MTPRKSREGGNLIEAVSNRRWPTPTARDWKDGASIGNVPVNATYQGSGTYLVSGLSPGSTTFTAKYRVTSGQGTFAMRSIVVVPLG